MLKSILKLEGAQQLSNNEQKAVIGGAPTPPGFCYCESLGYTVDCDNYDQICPLDY